jgi:DNA (cytosine-5)-methyltransferase 1
LATLSDLGYLVEWRVINAADFGFAQRRRRVFIVGRRIDKTFRSKGFDGFNWTTQEGVLARALPCTSPNGTVVHEKDFIIEGEPHEVSSNFGLGCSASPFADAGVMLRREVWTRKVQAAFSGGPTLLSEVLIHDAGAVAPYLIDEDKVGAAQEPEPGTWRHAKGSKSEERIHKGSGAAYRYSEGALPFPDPLNRPARTILTGEGGSGSSRFKHVVDAGAGRYRRLAPVELERLNGFPDGWTEGMSPVRRAFCMGNALVVGVVRKIGEVLAEDMSEIRTRPSRG